MGTCVKGVVYAVEADGPLFLLRQVGDKWGFPEWTVEKEDDRDAFLKEMNELGFQKTDLLEYSEIEVVCSEKRTGAKNHVYFYAVWAKKKELSASGYEWLDKSGLEEKIEKKEIDAYILKWLKAKQEDFATLAEQYRALKLLQ